jgi:hypothetical protein
MNAQHPTSNIERRRADDLTPARTTELIVNVVVPFLLALPRDGDRARVEPRLHNVYCSLRPLTDFNAML